MNLLELPPDLTRQVLYGLDAKDLSNRCTTDRETVNICSDPSFWRKKVLELNRRELEDDWFIELALLGESRLLSQLMAAIDYLEAQGLVKAPLIDERIVLIAYMALHWTNERDKLLNRLESWISDKFILSMTKIPLDRYVGVIKSAVEEQINLLQERRFDKIDDSLIRKHYIVSSFARLKMKTVLSSLPSPSCLIMRSLKSNSDNEKKGISGVLNDWLVPHLIKYGPENRLFVYRDDLNALKDELQSNRLLQLRSTYLRRYLVLRVLLHGSSDLVDDLLEGDWHGIADLMMSPISSEDAEVYQEVVKLLDYQPGYLLVGYISMEPDEWVKWFEGLPETVDRQEVIENTIKSALYSGYTHFTTIITDYAQKKGYKLN